ncbi:serine-type carboxypeptidase, partial [Metarhizium majus ARSEF 297]
MRLAVISSLVAWMWSFSLCDGRENPAAQQRPKFTQRGVRFDKWTRNGSVPRKFDNVNTRRFAVNGTGIPDVAFDIGEAYAGMLSTTNDINGTERFYFWFQPSPNPAAKKDIVIWLNGGPGCSSLEGFLQENGPFLWQYGTFQPVPNPWGWHHLSNVLWVEQPIGTGFSQGNVTARNEDDAAKQFLGFFRNFVQTFSMQGYKVYITGESYAGMYCPYIANAMLDANDTTHFNMKGMMIYDPVIGVTRLQNDIVTVPFIDSNRNLFPLNDSFVKEIHRADKNCGFAALRAKHLSYPPKGRLPSVLPGLDPKTGEVLPACSLSQRVQDAVTALNPCFNIYQIATTCPLLWDVLGFPGAFEYLPQGASLYFNRTDVKKAVNAPLNVNWMSCSDDSVFAGDGADHSEPSSNHVLGRVIDRTQNVIIGHGALDFGLIANGTLMIIQNMTFGGKQGFHKRPVGPFYVPYHTDGADATLAGAGVFGTAHTERGLTYVDVSLAGHMIPQYAPSAAYRHLEFLLGRVDSLSSTKPFTTDSESSV